MLKYITLSVLAAASLNSGADEPAVVTADLQQRHILGDTSELDRSKFFNVHSGYAGAALTPDDLEQLKQLNVGFGRAFDGPFSAHKSGPPYPDTETIKAKAEEVIAAACDHPLYPYRTTRRIMTNSVDDGFHMEADPKEMARFAADVIEFHYEDDTRPDFYSPLAIPFVAAGKYGEDQAEVRARMAAVFAEVGKEIDRRGLSTQVLGYTSAWPMMHYWDFKHWQDRMQMFMDVAGPHIDAMCFLLLDATHMQQPDNRRSGSRAEALLDLVETYGAIQWGEPKPFAFSEYGDVSHGWPHGTTYTPARSSAELNSYNHFLFQLLAREDRVLIAVPFLTTKSPWYYNQPRNERQPYSADLWRPDPESFVDGKPTRFLETEKMEFYRLWRDVRGHRAVTQSTDPDVVAYTFVDGAETFICLNNFEDGPREVILDVPGTLPAAAAITVKRLYVPKQQAVIYTRKKADALPTSLTLEAHETVIFHVTHAEAVAPSTTVKTRTHYSHDFLQPIGADQPVAIRITGVETDGLTAATLRLGLAREHDLSKQPKLVVNGRDIPFPDDWIGGDQAHRKQGFFGAIAIPVPADTIAQDNEITLTFPDDGGRVSTAVLEVTGKVANDQ
ncbi:hypothetical protein [Algisphaera agarilytica]|uniref:Uncharacterized protein n=1 Tax=Algisphaera agarilytica TaxID=1385975 RepID=A0A7X0H7R8_9BACT|nr:hypothetical protein [Algisphaera agarilytica]MBB6429370.1 hypothetical protein [Algisphaera agarilytica]